MSDQNKEYISINESARLLGVTPQTLRAWEKKGVLVPYRNPINKYRMYRVTQIEDFLQEMADERSQKGKFKLKVKIVKNSDSLPEQI